VTVTTTIHLRLPVEHVELLQLLAQENDRTLPDELRRAIRVYLKNSLQTIKIPA
jgi:predicted DNA-binding protein